MSRVRGCCPGPGVVFGLPIAESRSHIGRPRDLKLTRSCIEVPTRSVCPAVLAVAVLASTISVSARQDAVRFGGSPSQTVAIVPFVNLTGDRGDDWIGAGIAESLTTGLAGGYSVIVRVRVSDTGSEANGGSGDAPLEVGRRLGARYVVSGAYQRRGEVIRITGQFADVTTGTVVASAKVDGALDDLFSLQDRVVEELSGPSPRAAAARSPARVGPAVPDTAAVPAPATVVPTPAVGPPTASRPGGSSPAGTVADAGSSAGGEAALLAAIDGPPPPIAPEVVTRDERGRATVRAIKLAEGIQLDGELDEAVYHTVPAITGLIQQLPVEGASATEKTEAWIMFDDTNVYVSARVWDSAPEREWVANEMRRDTYQLRQNDNFTVFFDTFYDRRNGFNFYTNPLGARADQQVTNEGNPNSDWNPVWDVRTGRFDGGWTAEMEIPFKSLRYRSGSPQVWGVQLRRRIRRKNEEAYLTRLPISSGSGIFRVSAGGTLVGIEPPAASRNIEIKPYGIGGLTTDVNASPPKDGEGDGDFGIDVKYGITPNLTADFTYNADFAQVEVDEAAGEPDPLQPLLSREAGVLSGGTRHLRLRTGRHRRRRRVRRLRWPWPRQRANLVLQPAHRPARRSGGADPRWWSRHRQDRSVRRRRIEVSRPTTSRSPGPSRRTLPSSGSSATCSAVAAWVPSSRTGRSRSSATARARPMGWTPRSPSTTTSRCSATTPGRTHRGSLAKTPAIRGSLAMVATGTGCKSTISSLKRTSCRRWAS